MYVNEGLWREVQNYLPPQNRLDAAVMPREEFLALSNGHQIHLDIYAQPDAKAVVILLHGVGGNGRLLSFLAVPLYKNGYDVICPDLPLYGFSRYSGNITYNSWVTDAAEIAARYADRGRPVFLFGLSAGGMLAYQAACLTPAVRGVLATCILDHRLPGVTAQTAIHPTAEKFFSRLMPVVNSFLPHIKLPLKALAKMHAIVNDEALATLLMNDKKSGGASVPIAFLAGMLSPEISVAPQDFKTPFCLLHPENDRWTDVSLSRLFFDKLGCPKELQLLKGAGHFPIEPEGLSILFSSSVAFIEKYC